MVLPLFKRVKVGYSVSLILGAAGFVLCFFVHDKFMMFVPFLLIGCAWAAMLSMPFALLTNALSGSSSMGAYLGLFNCTICLPQIVAALLGGVIMKLTGGTQVMMLVVAGICLFVGSIAVIGIRTKK
jgi:maltose/moltooligosaccharide transporter